MLIHVSEIKQTNISFIEPNWCDEELATGERSCKTKDHNRKKTPSLGEFIKLTEENQRVFFLVKFI